MSTNHRPQRRVDRWRVAGVAFVVVVDVAAVALLAWGCCNGLVADGCAIEQSACFVVLRWSSLLC